MGGGSGKIGQRRKADSRERGALRVAKKGHNADTPSETSQRRSKFGRSGKRRKDMKECRKQGIVGLEKGGKGCRCSFWKEKSSASWKKVK